ncbi:hypothetical protein ACX9NE_22710 [Mycobacterium sp. ML4]
MGLIFSCHPALGPEARVALTLRLLGGLTVAEIAAAFLVPIRRWPSGSAGKKEDRGGAHPLWGAGRR